MRIIALLEITASFAVFLGLVYSVRRGYISFLIREIKWRDAKIAEQEDMLQVSRRDTANLHLRTLELKSILEDAIDNLNERCKYPAAHSDEEAPDCIKTAYALLNRPEASR